VTAGRALPRLYIVTDSRAVTNLPATLSVALAAAHGNVMVQLREKHLEGRALLDLGRQVAAVTRPRGCPLLVNDRIDLALALGADGVHLPESSFAVADARRLLGDDSLIGVSTHTPGSAKERLGAGADFVVCGPVWDTPSKRGMGDPIGVDTLQRACGEARGPVFAIGGVSSAARARTARTAGAHGVALIRAVLSAHDPAAASRDFLDALA